MRIRSCDRFVIAASCNRYYGQGMNRLIKLLYLSGGSCKLVGNSFINLCSFGPVDVTTSTMWDLNSYLFTIFLGWLIRSPSPGAIFFQQIDAFHIFKWVLDPNYKRVCLTNVTF